MESIVRKRHPNSLPVLMWAAAAAPDAETEKSLSVVFLEKQMKKLEEELEVKDGDAERTIRVLEQKYNVMKVGRASLHISTSEMGQITIVRIIDCIQLRSSCCRNRLFR